MYREEEHTFNLPDYISLKSDFDFPLTPLHPLDSVYEKDECLKSLVLSDYNPPTPARRMAGDLLYLVVTFNEGKCCHITASTKGFFVNQYVFKFHILINALILGQRMKNSIQNPYQIACFRTQLLIFSKASANLSALHLISLLKCAQK